MNPMSIDKLCDWGERAQPTMPCFQWRGVYINEAFMLTTEILQTLKKYTANMQKKIILYVQPGEHIKKPELMSFLEQFVSTSDKLYLKIADDYRHRSNISFSLWVEEAENKNPLFSGILFSGIPGGHEFNSLVLAVLQLSGTAIKLDENIKKNIQKISAPLRFEIFVSLACHNCPEIVQTINQFAILNQHISTETIDGGLFPSLIEERNIQGVPAVYLNGQLFANGKIDVSVIIEKIDAHAPKETAHQPTAEALPLQDVTVIGGGPAGVACAIYSARKGLKVTLIADRIGGQVKDTLAIENFIATPKTTGPQLVTGLKDHLKDYQINVKEYIKVTKLIDGNIKTLHLSSHEIIQTKTIIVATGAKWKELNIPGEKEYLGKGVAYCPHCDGPFFKDKDVAVIGGGNSGIEAALDLSGIVNSVTVFEFMDTFKADEILLSEAKKRDNIRLIHSVKTQEIIGENDRVTAILYIDRNTQKLHQQSIKGVFVQIGLVPNSQWLKGIVDLTQYGEIKINEKCETSQPGIFAAGDVTTVPYKQIIIAMGEGAKASLSAFEYLIKMQK